MNNLTYLKYPKADHKRKKMMTYFCFLTADLIDEMFVEAENLANLAAKLKEDYVEKAEEDPRMSGTTSSVS